MKNKIAHVLFFCILVGLPLNLLGSDLNIKLKKVGDETIEVSWDMDLNDLELKGINIYLFEGFITNFPSKKVDTLNEKAKLWYFNKRESENILGFELRKTDQIFDNTVWTPSETYTLGVEIEYINKQSQKVNRIRGFTYVFPFTIVEEANPDASNDLNSFDLKRLPPSITTFLKGNSFGIPVNPIKTFDYEPIENIVEEERFFKIYLASGKLVLYDKPPLRPEFLGGFSFIIYFSLICLVVLVCIFSFLFYLHVQAVNLKNSVDNEIYEFEKKQLLLSFINKNRLSVYVIFYLAKFFENKSSADNWHNKIQIVFRKNKLHQRTQIKADLIKLIEGNKVFKDPNSKKIFISYNHKDQQIAERVKEKLETNNFEVIIDTEAMKTGESIEAFIKNCIKQSAVTLSLISENSLVSAWVAMETIYSFYDVELRDKHFLPCNIDDSVIQRDFGDFALDKIKNEIDEIRNLINQRLEKNRGIEDLQLELTRYNKLYNELPTILSKLKNSLCADLSGNNFESGIKKVVSDINQIFDAINSANEI